MCIWKFAPVAMSGDEDGSPEKGRWGWCLTENFWMTKGVLQQEPHHGAKNTSHVYQASNIFMFDSTSLQKLPDECFPGSGWVTCLVERIRSAARVHEGCSWRFRVLERVGVEWIICEKVTLKDQSQKPRAARWWFHTNIVWNFLPPKLGKIFTSPTTAATAYIFKMGGQKTTNQWRWSLKFWYQPCVGLHGRNGGRTTIDDLWGS